MAEGWSAPNRAVPKPALPVYKDVSIAWSDEQSAVFGCAAPLLIEAFAGAGKTAVMLDHARRQGGQWLYLAYNRALAQEAARTADQFGVQALTLHSLAFSRYGHPLVHKIDRPWDARALSRVLGEDASHSAESTPELLREGLERFAVSADLALGLQHAPRVCADPERWLAMAEKVWAAMCDPTSPLGTFHEVYLKLFLLDPRAWPGRGILVDEVQDLTPGLQAALQLQSLNRPVIYAGDRHQRIYGFRGATSGLWNAIDNKVVLRESHRFGPEIAAAVQPILTRLGETRELVGKGPSGAAYAADLPAPGFTVLAPMHHELRSLVGALRSAGSSDLWARGPLAAELGLADSPRTDKSIRLSTVHAAKGETLDRVWLAPGIARGIAGDHDPLQAARLAYVAATRARLELAWHPSALASPSLRQGASVPAAAQAAAATDASWLD